MIQNDPKKIPKRPETTQNFKIGEIWNFVLAFVFQILSPNAQIWAFWPKSIKLLILTKFPMYLISEVLISNLLFVFKNIEPKSLNLGILGQRVLISNLNKILTGSNFEGADFKSDFRSRKFLNFITSL